MALQEGLRGTHTHTHTVYPGGHKSAGPPWSHKGGRAPCALAPVVRSVAGIKDIAAARTGRQGALGDGDRATRAPQSAVRIPPRLPIRVPSAPRRQLFPRAPLPSNPDPRRLPALAVARSPFHFPAPGALPPGCKTLGGCAPLGLRRAAAVCVSLGPPAGASLRAIAHASTLSAACDAAHPRLRAPPRPPQPLADAP